MKKVLLSAFVFVAFALNATNTVEQTTDSLANVENIVDSLAMEQDSLVMAVPAPVLEWDMYSTTSSKVKPDYLFVPLIFEEYVATDSVKTPCEKVNNDLELNVNDGWLKSSIANRDKVRKYRFDAMVKNPQNVPFNAADLPEPPKTYFISTDPSKHTVTLEERTYDNVGVIQGESVKLRRWIHSFNASIQFSQAYLSDNWYQGGENNVNVLGQVVWNVKLNDNIYKKLLFENNMQYKVGINSTPQDEMRKYSINQDLFQVNTKFGYKAIKKWYYSATMRFKTQLLNNYVANTNDMKASFLSPAELNLGLGMTYNTALKDNKLKFDMSLSPLSMDMNICREIKKIDPTSFGIDAGKHFKVEYGSNLEAKIAWKICHEVTWSSRLFTFTNYEHIQGDWENTLDFTINKYLSTRFYAHLRYDNSVAKDPSWKYWQLNEILSFGFNYTFSM